MFIEGYNFVRYKEKEWSYESSLKEWLEREPEQLIDLTGKIVVALEAGQYPVEIIGCYIPLKEHKAILKTIGHINFIIINDEIVLYKDDESWAQTWEEFNTNYSDIVYTCVEEYKKPKEYILKYIECYIKYNYDIDYEMNTDDLIILEGL